ncbi:hypothetical protein OE88DRAFT_1739227 [Heliocybe sulcata]|uniref:Uncharacterized protein n=1 Tax=Heliocybe sulcata TaxID=5364 RepID=A0A5C3MPC7_9AGAM|nr:hypothetical protein OE88DRAFT_1739227 [Heliocybe sulcata]
MIACLAISIPVGWALRGESFDGTIYYNYSGIVLGADLISVSAEQQTMVMDWWIYDYARNCTNSTLINTSMSLFFDQNLMRSDGSEGPRNNNPSSTPVFVINGTQYCSAKRDFRGSSYFFRTNLALNKFSNGRSIEAYPFDQYWANIVIYGNLPDNSTVPVSIGWTWGVATGFDAKMNRSDSGLYHDVAHDQVLIGRFTITRGLSVRILTFLSTCVAVLFLGRVVKSEVLVTPIASLFAFTSLRSTLPDAPPGFGANLDFMGILPCLAIIAFCAVLLTAVFLFRDPEKMHGDTPQSSTQTQALSSENPSTELLNKFDELLQILKTQNSPYPKTL